MDRRKMTLILFRLFRSIVSQSSLLAYDKPSRYLGPRGLTLPIEKIITLKTLIFSITMGANYSFYVKTIETPARAFLKVIILSIGSVGFPAYKTR